MPCHSAIGHSNNNNLLLQTPTDYTTPQNCTVFTSAAPRQHYCIMLLFVSGVPTPPWADSFYSFVSSSFSLLHSNPTSIAILLTLTLVPLVLWIDTIGKNPGSSLNNMAVKDPAGDFKGDVKVNNNPPTKGVLEKAADLPVLDQNRKKYTFKSLYADNENGPRRVLIIFIRHFFCGVCSPPATLPLLCMTLTYIHRTARSTSVPSRPLSPLTPSPPYPRLQKSSSSAAANLTSYLCTLKKQDALFPCTPTLHENYITCSA